jgi:hypothetical protein
MGVNSKAIERIDEQIRMLDEDYASNNDRSDFEESISEEDSITLKIDSIDEIDDIEVLDDDSNTTKENKKIELEDNNIEKVNEEDTEDGVNIFLMYYVGIILIAIVLLIIIYFLFT